MATGIPDRLCEIHPDSRIMPADQALNLCAAERAFEPGADCLLHGLGHSAAEGSRSCLTTRAGTPAATV